MWCSGRVSRRGSRVWVGMVSASLLEVGAAAWRLSYPDRSARAEVGREEGEGGGARSMLHDPIVLTIVE